MAQEFNLPTDISELAEQAVAKGRFRSVEDVLRAGVRAVVAVDFDDDGLSDDERAAAEQLLLDRLNDGEALQPLNVPALMEECQSRLRARRANRR